VKEKLEDELKKYVKEAINKLSFFKKEIMDEI